MKPVTVAEVISTDAYKALPPDKQAKLLATAKEEEQRQRLFVGRSRHCYRPLTCWKCGKKDRRGAGATLCRKCQKKANRESRTMAQSVRRKASNPLYERVDAELFSMMVRKSIACKCCGKKFKPERTTARFCSPKCRVRWSRR